MKTIYRAYSQHYCPTCSNKVKRIKPTFIGGILLSLMLLVPYCIIWLIAAFLLEQFIGSEAWVAITCSLIALIFVNPLFFILSSFRCDICDKILEHHELTCKR